MFSSVTAEASCGKALNAESLSFESEKELSHLNEAQKAFASNIQKDWMNNIWNENKQEYKHAFYSLSNEDKAVRSLLTELGFLFLDEKQQIVYPFYIWNFLEKARYKIGNRKDGIIPAVVIQNKDTKQLMYITRPSDLPKDPRGWYAIEGQMDEKAYYSTINQGYLPFTVGESFEDHEIQHLISLYHPDGFPHYMKEVRELGRLYVEGEIGSKFVFLFAEAFGFVRNNPETKDHFEGIVNRWALELDSFAELKKQIETMPAQDLEQLSVQFLEAYPKYVLYRGGVIRDNYNVPAEKDPNEFLKKGIDIRAQQTILEKFRYQNWRMLYKNLVIAHNSFYQNKASYKITASHLGWTPEALERLCMGVSFSVNNDAYLRIGLAELIWAIEQSYKLNMTAAQLMHASIHRQLPHHMHVKKYFEDTYGAVFGRAVDRSVYVQAFLDPIPKKALELLKMIKGEN